MQAMFAVIFTVQPKSERWDDYLKLAKYLKPKLEAIDGFIDNERFESKQTKGRLLSLSTWRDEKSVVRWRTQGEHHSVQSKGRFEIFEDYHLSVGQITEDSDPPDGFDIEGVRFDETAVGAGRVATIVELAPKEQGHVELRPDRLAAEIGLDTGADGLVDAEAFESIYQQGKLLLLALWLDVASAQRWSPRHPAFAKTLRYRRVRIIRDYGMFDRREAPQFFRKVQPSEHIAAA
jgi:heme-degrading monooxygenase HmoA